MAIPRYLRVKEVVALTTLSRTTIWRYVILGVFPEPTSLGARSIAWPEPEIERWLKSRNRLKQVETLSSPTT